MVRAAVTKTEERMRQYLRNPPPAVPPSASSASASAYSSSVASGTTAGSCSIQDTSSRMGALVYSLCTCVPPDGFNQNTTRHHHSRLTPFTPTPAHSVDQRLRLREQRIRGHAASGLLQLLLVLRLLHFLPLRCRRLLFLSVFVRGHHALLRRFLPYQRHPQQRGDERHQVLQQRGWECMYQAST